MVEFLDGVTILDEPAAEEWRYAVQELALKPATAYLIRIGDARAPDGPLAARDFRALTRAIDQHLDRAFSGERLPVLYLDQNIAFGVKWLPTQQMEAVGRWVDAWRAQQRPAGAEE